MIQFAGPSDAGTVVSSKMLSGPAQLEEKKRLAAMTAGAALSEDEKAAIQRRRADSAARLSAEVKTNDELQAKLARRRAASESEEVPGSQGIKEEPHGSDLDGSSSELQAKL